MRLFIKFLFWLLSKNQTHVSRMTLQKSEETSFVVYSFKEKIKPINYDFT